MPHLTAAVVVEGDFGAGVLPRHYNDRMYRQVTSFGGSQALRRT